MAEITRVNGDAQPVFAIDVRNGPVAPSTATAGTPVNLAGPKLDFFQVTANATVAGEQGVDEYVANVIQAVQQTCTVAIYQVDAAQISFAIYPTGAFANTTVFLDTANITYTGFQLDSCTNVGFKLATS
jgi:hypothetical protein